MPSRQFVASIGWWPFAKRFVWRQLNKRLLGRGVSIRLPTGLVMYAPRWSQSASEAVYTNADVDWGSERLLVRHLDKAGTFIDVGAHVGYYTLYVAPRVQKVYAFEPDARSFAALSRNLAQCAHAEPVNKAVFSKSGTMEMIKRGDTAGFSHLVGPNGSPAGNKRSIEVVSVDDWMLKRTNERVTGIKIDIDGLDFEVLMGAMETIERDQPLVLIEFFPSETNNFDDLFDALDRLNYAAFAFKRGDGTTHPLYRLSRGTAEHGCVKMIFLTPSRLEDTFGLVLCEGQR